MAQASLEAGLTAVNPVFIVVALILVAQAWMHWRLPAAELIGDEVENLERTGWADPYGIFRYVRVPLYVFWLRCCVRFSAASPDTSARYSGLLLSVLTLGFCALTLDLTANKSSLMAAALLVLLLPERLILASRLWPDTMLTMLGAMLCWLLLLPPGLGQVMAVGVTLALLAMARIEQIVLLPACVAGLVLESPGYGFLEIVLTVAPTIFALGAWTLRNWRRYAIPWPDTTWQFNVRLARIETTGPLIGAKTDVQNTVTELCNRGGVQWNPARDAQRVRSWHAFGHLLRRVLALVGRDSFVGDRLLPALDEGSADRHRFRVTRLGLIFGFPLCAAITVWLLAMNASALSWTIALPMLALMLALVLVHFRTRYRLVLLPWMIVASASSQASLDPDALGAGALAGLIVLLLAALVNAAFPWTVDLPPEPVEP